MKSKLITTYSNQLVVGLLLSYSLLLAFKETACSADTETGPSSSVHQPQHSHNNQKWLFMNASSPMIHKPQIASGKSDNPGNNDAKNLNKEEQNYASDESIDMTNVIFIDQILSTNAGIIEDRITDIPSTPSVIKLVEPPHKIQLDTLVEEKINAALQNTTKSKKQPAKTVLTEIEELSTDQPVASQHSNDPVLEILPKDGGKHTTFHTDPGGVIEEVVTPTAAVAEVIEVPPASLEGELGPEMNLTAEEHPIPVFSEWAQKHLEEAEKKMEEEKVNSSTQKKSSASSQKAQNGKLATSMKVRAKNYASPDCGAKIIATNPDAQSTGAILTSHRDEYFLSPCTSRIWFVVELCEAIQAESIELANFELFSSSPKEFAVSVGARFPTRDWSTVGQFTAKDERDVQSFQLHPHLFGKFVRVEVNSHYNSEHYCPISLFRVYGTSEMEAFETENQPHPATDGDEDDEDDALATTVKRSEGDGKKNNILKSAGEAVMNIVKKAAEALGKSGQNQTDNTNSLALADGFTKERCLSLSHDIACYSCTSDQMTGVYSLLSCKMPTISSLLDRLASNLYQTQQCAKLLGFNLGDNKFQWRPTDVVSNFLEKVLASRYFVAMCNLLAIEEKKLPLNVSCTSASSSTRATHHLDNKTIDVAVKDKAKNGPTKNLSSLGQAISSESVESRGDNDIAVTTTSQVPPIADTKLMEATPPSVDVELKVETTTQASSVILSEEDLNAYQKSVTDNEAEIGKNDSEATQGSTPSTEDVNIFNIVPEKSQETETEVAREITEAPATEMPLQQETPETNFKPTLSPPILSEEILTTPEDLPSLVEPSTDMPTTPPYLHQQKNQPESVFLRLTNRIKALERNMSLSGQYLEELSKRYKKQVEELQLSFAKTLQSIEAQNRKSSEREQLLIDQNQMLRQDFDALVARIYNWKNILLYCGGFFVVQVAVMCLIAKGCFGGRSQEMRPATPKSTEKLIDRRNSVEGVMSLATAAKNSPITTQPRRRRPSEEALNIVGHYENLLIADNEGNAEAARLKRLEEKRRRRKNSNKTTKRAISEEIPVERIRKTGAKVALFRTDSAPANYENFSSSSSGVGGIAGATGEGSSGSFSNRIDELPLLEDNDEFIIPGASDYSYNEFVPSNVNVTSTPQQPNSETVSVSSLESKKSASSKLSKARRLSSPAFLKNALTRSSSRQSNKSQTPSTEPTGWEWYKLRRSSNTGANAKVRKKSKSDNPLQVLATNGESSTDAGATGDGFTHNNNNKSSSVSLSSDVVVNLGHSSDSKENGIVRITPPPSPVDSLTSPKPTSLSRQKSGGSFRKIFRKMF